MRERFDPDPRCRSEQNGVLTKKSSVKNNRGTASGGCACSLISTTACGVPRSLPQPSEEPGAAHSHSPPSCWRRGTPLLHRLCHLEELHRSLPGRRATAGGQYGGCLGGLHCVGRPAWREPHSESRSPAPSRGSRRRKPLPVVSPLPEVLHGRHTLWPGVPHGLSRNAQAVCTEPSVPAWH
jgi:hypothetical protein